MEALDLKCLLLSMSYFEAFLLSECTKDHSQNCQPLQPYQHCAQNYPVHLREAWNCPIHVMLQLTQTPKITMELALLRTPGEAWDVHNIVWLWTIWSFTNCSETYGNKDYPDHLGEVFINQANWLYLKWNPLLLFCPFKGKLEQGSGDFLHVK